MLKNVLWVDENPFIGKLMEDISKRENFKLYHLNNLKENFAYLIKDLDPEIIVTEENFVKSAPENFWASIKDAEYKGIMVLMGEKQADFNYFIKKPINPFETIKYLKSLVK